MFDEFSTIKGLRAFEKKLYDALYDFCEDRKVNDVDVILGIYPVTLDVKVYNRYFVPSAMRRMSLKYHHTQQAGRRCCVRPRKQIHFR